MVNTHTRTHTHTVDNSPIGGRIRAFQTVWVCSSMISVEDAIPSQNSQIVEVWVKFKSGPRIEKQEVALGSTRWARCDVVSGNVTRGMEAHFEAAQPLLA